MKESENTVNFRSDFYFVVLYDTLCKDKVDNNAKCEENLTLLH